MSVYYIRKTGSDASAGTSAGAAWLTIGKALGASGIASGDTVYIGAGVYRETIDVIMTAATVETFVIGDVDGSHTGDVGEVVVTGYTKNDTSTSSATTLVSMAGKNFLTYQDIIFISGTATIITANSTACVNVKFIRCQFISAGQATATHMLILTAANTTANWVIDSCTFIVGANIAIAITQTRPTGADFDVGITIKNCFIFSAGVSAGINFTATGANLFKAGGAKIYNCTYFGAGVFVNTSSANCSTTIPILVYNSFVYGGLNTSGLVANSSGQITEDYNVLLSGFTPRSNVTAGAHTISDGSYAPLFFTGHEYYSVGSNLQPFGMPKPGSPLLGFGNQASSPTVDIIGVARPSGFVKAATGTATVGAAKTLTDSGQTWGTDIFAGYTIKIISGTGSGQTKTIASNTATVLTVDGNWKTNPDSTSVYEIYLRATSSTGTATSGTTTTLTDSNASWGAKMWTGYTLTIDTGTGNGQTFTVTSNTSTALTFAAGTAPDNTSTYSLFRGTNVNTINAGVGCYEYGQSAIRETTTVKTSVNALRIPGAGYHDFAVPVSAVANTITIYARYDSAYSGTLPSMNIVNGTECGVANATATCVGAANAWEQLSLTFTPTVAGIITIRLLSSTTTPTGNAFFDDWDIT